VAAPRAGHARTPWLAAEGPPDQTGRRPGPAARPIAPASDQGQRLGCGLRPPSDVWSSQHQIINGGRPCLLVGRVAPHSTTSQVTIYGWSTRDREVKSRREATTLRQPGEEQVGASRRARSSSSLTGRGQQPGRFRGTLQPANRRNVVALLGSGRLVPIPRRPGPPRGLAASRAREAGGPGRRGIARRVPVPRRATRPPLLLSEARAGVWGRIPAVFLVHAGSVGGRAAWSVGAPSVHLARLMAFDTLESYLGRLFSSWSDKRRPGRTPACSQKLP
jgi:hypothetical protein